MSDARGFDIEKAAQQIAEVVTHPQYQAMIEELRQTPEQQRVEVARRVLTREELIRRGIHLPDEFRITLRWFEDPDSRWPISEATYQPVVPLDARMTICGSIGYIICVSAGG